MIIGGDKTQVIENIRQAAKDGDLNRKVEPGDPVLSGKKRLETVYAWKKNTETFKYRLCSWCARRVEDVVGWTQNRDTEIRGLENLNGLTGGAVVTSNHFNPLDSTVVRHLALKTGRRRLYAVSQDTNFVVPGFLGFFLYYADTIPLTGNARYLDEVFTPYLKKLFSRGQWVLIYPEQEMWFNYRKPRTPKRGAYYYAAKCGVPVVSCFVEMQDQKAKDNEQFKKVKYIVHVLPPIRPDPGKTPRENSLWMQKKDYEQKKQAYEEAYHKKLDYRFEKSDIAGLI